MFDKMQLIKRLRALETHLFKFVYTEEKFTPGELKRCITYARIEIGVIVSLIESMTESSPPKTGRKIKYYAWRDREGGLFLAADNGTYVEGYKRIPRFDVYEDECE